jgi:DNA-binding ferritin-like protein
MHNLSIPIPTRPMAIPQALPARPIQDFPGDRSAENGALLIRLMQEESALYAITREWRYDAASRKFMRLHALLDEQFSEIGTRLVRLAKHNRDLTCWNSTGHSGGGAPSPAVVGDDGLEVHIIRQLLDRHAAMLAVLKHGAAAIGESIHVQATHQLLAELTAEHEKDAFLLRALLWEVQQTAA